MKKSHILVFVFIFSGWNDPESPTSLFPYKAGEAWGYMDATGTKIIQPIFKSVNPYSEGLAAVRKDGYYGYIDPEAKLQIPYQFDFAESFHGETARVFIGSKPYIIDKTGKILFEHSYKAIGRFNDDGLSIVYTPNGHYGLVDKKGKMIADTIYSNIKPFREGFAVVQGLKHDPYPDGKKKRKYEVGLINRKGELQIPFGRFLQIGEFNEGIAGAYLTKEIKTKRGTKTDQVYIDTTGKILFTVDEEEYKFDTDSDDFHQQLCPVTIPMKRKIPGTDDRDSYAGVINVRGEIVFSDSTWEEVSYFSNNRAFAKLKTGGWRMINLLGNLVGSDVYDEILTIYEQYWNKRVPFLENRCWVQGGKEVSAIDTNGNTIHQVPTVNFDFDEIFQHKEWLLFREDVSDKDEEFEYIYALYNSSTGRLIEPSFGGVNMNEPADPLLGVLTRKSWGYINQEGKIIWEEKSNDKDSMNLLDIDHMTRGYFYASSPYRNGHEGFGGWGGSKNGVQKVDDRKQFNKNRLEIILDATQQCSWAGRYKGMKAFVANGTADTVLFEAQDSRLYLKMQAMDSKGEWRDIEYLPNSWCGNSYHTLHLAPGQYWEFKLPVYHGEFKTKLRLELASDRFSEKKKPRIIYSNIIEGSINPAQFWRKQGYSVKGIMDPYFE